MWNSRPRTCAVSIIRDGCERVGDDGYLVRLYRAMIGCCLRPAHAPYRHPRGPAAESAPPADLHLFGHVERIIQQFAHRVDLIRQDRGFLLSGVSSNGDGSRRSYTLAISRRRLLRRIVPASCHRCGRRGAVSWRRVEDVDADLVVGGVLVVPRLLGDGVVSGGYQVVSTIRTVSLRDRLWICGSRWSMVRLAADFDPRTAAPASATSGWSTNTQPPAEPGS